MGKASHYMQPFYFSLPVANSRAKWALAALESWTWSLGYKYDVCTMEKQRN